MHPGSTSKSDTGTPFFVVGPMRSGTTLLRLMVASHPRLAIPPESHFLPELFEFENAAGGLVQSRTRIIEWIISHRRLADFKLDPEWMRTTLSTLEPFTTRNIACTLFAEYARREGKARWGDKTPRYRSFLPQLHSLFPEGKFIHVLRDGRDTALSAWRAKFGPKTWADAVYDWRKAIRDVRKGQRAIPPDSFFEVRYEDLILHAEPVLKRICTFLCEEYDPKMLRFSDTAQKEVPSWESSWHSKLQKPLDAGNAGKWKTALTPDQLLLFNRVAGSDLIASGYEPSLVHPSALVRAKCIGAQFGWWSRNSLLRFRLSGRSRRPFEKLV